MKTTKLVSVADKDDMAACSTSILSMSADPWPVTLASGEVEILSTSNGTSPGSSSADSGTFSKLPSLRSSYILFILSKKVLTLSIIPVQPGKTHRACMFLLPEAGASPKLSQNVTAVGSTESFDSALRTSRWWQGIGYRLLGFSCSAFGSRPGTGRGFKSAGCPTRGTS